MAMPSPVVTPGFVVLGYTWPAPPVASIVTGATNLQAGREQAGG
jgi:hypothetical protein